MITWRREPARREFHFGPVFSFAATPGAGRIALAGGLLGFRRLGGQYGWQPFWFDFSARPEDTPLSPPR
ncbi:MAG: hypothetical protein EXS39_05120 [Opitutaceae bacterium]|nr:hypothetical protein [Opitutaceae bacterium]